MKQVIKNIRPNAWMWVAAAFVLTFLLELELWARLGGGGGYSGGGAGYHNSSTGNAMGGGGGSVNNGTNKTDTVFNSRTNGFVTITAI